MISNVLNQNADHRGVVAVNRQGVLGLITARDGQTGSAFGVTAEGDHWSCYRPVVLGRLNDWLASGRPFAQWLRDRGYQAEVPDTTEHVFLARAQAVGVI